MRTNSLHPSPTKGGGVIVLFLESQFQYLQKFKIVHAIRAAFRMQMLARPLPTVPSRLKGYPSLQNKPISILQSPAEIFLFHCFRKLGNFGFAWFEYSHGNSSLINYVDVCFSTNAPISCRRTMHRVMCSSDGEAR
jgi:hypothetical protein